MLCAGTIVKLQDSHAHAHQRRQTTSHPYSGIVYCCTKSGYERRGQPLQMLPPLGTTVLLLNVYIGLAFYTSSIVAEVYALSEAAGKGVDQSMASSGEQKQLRVRKTQMEESKILYQSQESFDSLSRHNTSSYSIPPENPPLNLQTERTLHCTLVLPRGGVIALLHTRYVPKWQQGKAISNTPQV